MKVDWAFHCLLLLCCLTVSGIGFSCRLDRIERKIDQIYNAEPRSEEVSSE